MTEEDNQPKEKTEIVRIEQKTEKTALEKKLDNFKLPKFKLPKPKEIPGKIAHLLREYKRVIIVSKKPDIDELSKISKISGIGILIIGFLGFVIQLVFQLIKGVA